MSGYDKTPTLVTRPEDTVPRFFRLREAIAELLGDEEGAATLRWRDHNASQPRRCPCGRPGTVRVGYAGHYVVGSVDPYWWRCDDHAAVPLSVPWSGGEPLTGQARGDCSWWTCKNDTRRITECGCGTHVGEVEATQ